MHYKPYFSLNLFHTYYQHNTCADFVIEPTRSCQRLLQGHRLVLKLSTNGLQVLVPFQEDASQPQPVIPLAESLVFTFLLRLKNPDFINFTELKNDYRPNSSLYVFSNDSLSDESQLELTSELLKREARTKLDQPPSPMERLCARIAELQTAQRSNLFGAIEIHKNDSLAKDFSKNREFKITFKASQIKWTYYLVAMKDTSDAVFSIQEDPASQNAIAFDQVLPKTSDRISERINRLFPDTNTIVFQSKEPVPCQNIGRSKLQLMLTKAGSSSICIDHLPNPPNQHGIQVINLLHDV